MARLETGQETNRLERAYPSRGQHPVGPAYDLYHLSEDNPAPVDANALVVIDRVALCEEYSWNLVGP